MILRPQGGERVSPYTKGSSSVGSTEPISGRWVGGGHRGQMWEELDGVVASAVTSSDSFRLLRK